VGKNFDMRHDAKTRIYNYIAPSRLFQTFDKFNQNHQVEEENLSDVVGKLN
jgi:tRNA U38,U39,U40 pseudouridine synthase TruA